MEETNECLGEYLSLYQIHSATFESGVLKNEEVHAALDKCRSERGWTIGLSVSSPQQGDVLSTAMKLTVQGGQRKLFDSVQCTYNLLEQRPGHMLQEAQNAGMDIIIKEGLANGRILQHASVLNYSQQLGCTPDQLALACILAQPFEPRVLSGAISPDQLQSNLGASRIAETLRQDPTLLEEIMKSCVMESEDYWAERTALAWN